MLGGGWEGGAHGMDGPRQLSLSGQETATVGARRRRGSASASQPRCFSVPAGPPPPLLQRLA